MVKKGFTYKDFGVVCNVCGRSFRTPQALQGHLRFTPCGQAGGEAQPNPPEGNNLAEQPSPVIPPSVSNKAAREKLERFRIEAELRKFGVPSQPTSRIEELRELLAIAKEFGGELSQDGQPKMPSWLQLLNSPNLALVIAGLRGALGVGQGQGGDLSGIATVLQLVGAKDLKSLLGGSPVATAPEAFDLPDGTHIPKNFPLEPNLLLAIMKQKNGDPMANALTDAVTRITKLWEEDKAMKRGGSVGSKAADVDVVICPQCGTETRLPGDLKVGDEIKCSNPGCNQLFHAVDEGESEPKVNKPPRRRQAKVKEPPKETLVCSCGQSLDISNKQPGDIVRCPICDSEHTLVSETEAIPVAEPLSESEKILRRRQEGERRE